MTMKTLVIIFVLFFIQPIFIAGLFYAWWNRKKRLAYVRETYRMNFNRTAFEISDYFFKALGWGVLLSALSFLLGIPLTIEWYMLYQLITIALLILSGSRLIHPLFTFSMTSISLFLMQKFGQKLPLNWLENLRDQKAVAIHFEANSMNNLLLNSLLFIFLI
ncbi:MAG: hypothetical protein L0I93_03650, partial [Atopostipes suicloacalis]|nr:hypothetical protein [Atopostipes suicloacalis]